MATRLLMSGLIWALVPKVISPYERNTPRIVASGDPQLTPCGEYSSQVLTNGKCKIIATLPQQDGHRCPDVFRCTDEVSYWLHQNEKRKQEILELREFIAELQEQLRSHRHRLRILEQTLTEDASNATLAHRVQSLEVWASESSTLQHLQATFIYEIQAQLLNLSLMMDRAHHNSSCLSPTGYVQSSADVRHQTSDCHTDCSTLYHNGVRRSGVYTILPSTGGTPVQAFCDMDTEGGGWTVVQRRQDGSVNFNRTWRDYKEGFGDLSSEFWLGNENLHRITSHGGYSLRIDLEDWEGEHKYALYQEFSVEDEANYYRVHVSGPSGTAEDSFAWYHDKMSFSTEESGNLCAEISHGGWWYHQCFYANLNGVYYPGGRYVKGHCAMGPDGIVWYSWANTDYYSLKKVSMMVRPRTFQSHISP